MLYSPTPLSREGKSAMKDEAELSGITDLIIENTSNRAYGFIIGGMWIRRAKMVA